jgi:predicted GIY-YIG superfamily endonuclease
VKQRFEELLTRQKYTVESLPKDIQSGGIYLFSEDNHPLYVGRANKLSKRIKQHTRNSHNQATFAFLLARHKTGNIKASYRQKGSRKDLLKDPKFRAAFDAARQRIRSMDVQFVEENDPVKQTILEVFAAFQTEAKYNDFENH